MITLPKLDLEKLVNDLMALSDRKFVDLKISMAVNKDQPVKMTFSAETGITSPNWVGGLTPEELITAVKSHAQQIYLQFNTSTQKISGKRARDRVRLAAALFKEIIPDGELLAYKDGDFVFCRLIQKEDVKKLEEALTKHGWTFGKKPADHDGHGGEIKGTSYDHWTIKCRDRNDMKLPEMQDRVSFAVRIGPIPSMWKIIPQNGREIFEFWFDEFSS